MKHLCSSAVGEELIPILYKNHFINRLVGTIARGKGEIWQIEVSKINHKRLKPALISERNLSGHVDQNNIRIGKYMFKNVLSRMSLLNSNFE
jgi:hypothetical protein